MNEISPITSQGPLARAMSSAASGMRAQALRARLVAENLANANSTSSTPGGMPYQRKMMTFAQAIDHATGAGVVVLTGAGVTTVGGTVVGAVVVTVVGTVVGVVLVGAATRAAARCRAPTGARA